jgi:DNA-binding NarL/FixJ family response regulator
MRILIADDNERVRRGIAAVLAAVKNWEVCGEAEDGTQAIQKAAELRPDLVVLDVSMPGMDGLETARRLRRANAEIKILVLSQYDPAQLLPQALEVGANACVDKSRIGADLVRTIKSIFESSKNDLKT